MQSVQNILIFSNVTTATDLTLESPGDGVASVLMISVSFSVWNGFAGRSNVDPLTLTGCRTGRDHIPRAPPIACILRFVRVGRSFYTMMSVAEARAMRSVFNNK